MKLRTLLVAILFAASASGADFGVRVILGLTDKAETKWDGSALARGASIASIEPWRFDGADALSGSNSWRLSTHPIRLFGGSTARPVVANGIVLWLTGASDSTEIDVRTAQGDFSVKLADIPYGRAAYALDRRVMIDRIPPVQQLTDSKDEQDYPAAVSSSSGGFWVAYLEFRHHPEHDRLRANLKEAPKNFSDYARPPGGDRIAVKRYSEGKWSVPLSVTGGGEDLYRPAIAIDGNGIVWVFWPANVKGNFDLWACPIKDGRPGRKLRLSNEAGSDIDPVATTDSKGRVWVAWQGWRNGRASIHYTVQEGGRFGRPGTVAASDGNEWNPAIAAADDGRVSIAWDSYRNGNYDVFLRTARPDGAWGPEAAIAVSARYEAYPSIAFAPGGRLWVAYEEGSERWGKDFGADESSGIALYQGRATRLIGVEPDGRRVQVAADIGAVLPGEPAQRVDSQSRQEAQTGWLQPRSEAWKNRGGSRATQPPPAPKNSYPRVAVDRSGRLWVAVRSAHPIWWNPLGTVWHEHLVSYDGKAWTGPVWLSHTDNLLDNRPVLLAPNPGELVIVSSSDRRRHFHLSQLGPQKSASIAAIVEDPYRNDLYTTRVSLSPAPGPLPVVEVRSSSAAAPSPDDRIEAEAIERMRTARVQDKYRVVRGEFHRHSDVSMDGGNDGSLLDQWRYMLDAARMEWAGCCDHDNGGGREYSWWITQKLTDIFYTPGRFVPMFSYERSVSYPEGHRNTILVQRGVRPLPRLPKSQEQEKGPAPDTQMFYAYLRHFNGIVASHTSATNMGTDWRDNDPRVEPVVEIYQGERQNYERPDAPRANSEADSIGGWRPKGFVNLALEMGYKMAFQASSDHISTHMSYCNIVAAGLTREEILDAFQKRHVYGSTDNILADFRSGSHIMGDVFTTSSAPEFSVKLVGTAPFAKVHIIKDNRYVYTTEPGASTVDFRWRDQAAEPGKMSYYYVRGEQKDGEIVWASPMWITWRR